MYEELVKHLRFYEDGTLYYKQAADAIEELKRDLDFAIRAEAAATEVCKPRWIPVKERLPEKNGFYLCLYELKQKGGFGMEEGLGILQFIDNKWSIFDIYVVTHWFPIPEQPKEET